MGEITAPSVRTYDTNSHLTVSDVHVAVDNNRNPTVIRVHLKRMKTAQYSGIDVHLGKMDNELCLVASEPASLHCCKGNVSRPPRPVSGRSVLDKGTIHIIGESKS